MKKLYFTLVLLSCSFFVFAQTGTSEEVGITEGQLSVSLTGGANYVIPIAVPPGINGVVPQVSLAYNSQGGNGMAGYGWNISGVSAITRIPRTQFHDGVVGGVNLDANDRFALDGQRLIVKSGTTGIYGADGTVYETESFSNLKITSIGTHPSGVKYGPSYFKVEYPDGSVALYGNSTDSRSKAKWGITYWQNAQNVRISYNYIVSNNNSTIEYIKYGNTGALAPINQIKFVYKPRQKPEQSYIAGESFLSDAILSEIQVTGNTVGFRNYILAHDAVALGYEFLKTVTEKSGDNTKAYNPTVFTYDNTTPTVINNTIYNLGLGSDVKVYDRIDPSTGVNLGDWYDIKSTTNYDDSGTLSGDFDGDGKLDIVTYSNLISDPLYRKYFGAYLNIKDDIVTNYQIDSPYKFSTNLFFHFFTSNNFTGIAPNQKLAPYQFVTYLQKSSDDNKKIIFRSHNFKTGSQYALNKSITFPDDVPRQYLDGDFNGDGITDMIAVENYSSSKTSFATYFIDLDARKTSNYSNYSGEIDKELDSGYRTKLSTGDFNSDGKTDIYFIFSGYVKVYSLGANNQLYLLYENVVYDNDIDFGPLKQIVMGDFNGDGKTDFMIPKNTTYSASTSIWYRYISTGSNFIKTSKDFQLELVEDTTPESYNGAGHNFNYIPTDYNNDGSTDIIVVHRKRESSSYGFYTTYNPQVISIHCFISKNDGFEKITLYEGASFNDTTIPDDAIPIFLTSKHSKQSQQIALLKDNKIYPFPTLKDFSNERLLKTITTGNGVKETISYSPVFKDSCTINCQSIVSSVEGIENYPNRDIANAPGFEVVSMIEKQSATVYKKQLFKYHGAVSNMEGLGFLGFRATMRTNWHDDSNSTPVISTITKTDVNLRGAATESFSVLGLIEPSKILAPTDSFISRNINTYNMVNGIFENPLQANKVYKLKLTQSKQINGLDNTSSETTTEYDSYNNPLTSTTLIKEDNTTVQTTVTAIAYKPVTTTLPYLLGIPASKNQSITANDDTMTTEELYTYTSNLLTVIKKKGHNTPDVTETNTYSTYGSITRKVITAAPAISRTTRYVYDTSKRFIIKTTDVKGVITNYIYNQNNGLLESETNHFGQTTSYLYDPWFKKIKTTDYLGKTNTYAYSKEGINTKITSTGELDEGSYSEELYDDLGRKIRTGIKDIQSAMSFKEYQYDIYDRDFSVSEPFTTNPTQWNITQFDVYGRPIAATDFMGKTISVVYDKLTTTTTDSSTGNTKASTKNAMGNVVKMIETPAGGNPQTVDYSYYANGNLKETDYSGTKTTITQDGWGRKTSLTDSSAGLYSYTYTDIGEILTETTPNGTTTYTYDARGNVTKKVIIGNNTNNNTVYTYDSIKRLITKSVFTDVADANKKITTLYTYDLQGRLITTNETTGYGAVFTKTLTYDAWGRADIETSTASLAGKTSTTNTQNTYKNGFAYQITDAQSTNPKILWETSEVNARGQLTKAKLGNNIEINNLYDTFGYITKTKHDLLTTNILEFDTDFDPQRGNLKSRKNSLFGNIQEDFGYDSQDRLKTYPDAQGNPVTQTYKDDGRIDTNTLGTYNYDSNEKKYQNTSISLEPEDASYYANREGIFSDGMEGSGWLIYEPEVFSYDTSQKHLGNTSLRINNPASSEKVIHSEVWTKIDNTVDTSYTYSAWVYSDAPQAELFLMMKTDTETGYATLTDSKFTNVTNQWIRIEGTFVVPANIKKLNLRLDNNSQGNVWFDDVLIRKTFNTTPLSNLQIPNQSYLDRKLAISYNAFKAPIEISEAAIDKISFVYNSNNDRSVMFYCSLQADKEYRVKRKYYSADGSMEIKQNLLTGIIEFVTYIGGNGYSAPVVVKSDGVTQSFLYLHRDYQGSIIAITNDAGTVLEKRQFDAWGAIIKVQDGSGNNLNGLTILDRGYTGHEHLQSVGIINMNGRLYDPKLHRFLQPDNYVQDPSNTQNYNRYSYVLNNPLKYIDPSGEKWKIGWKDIVAGLQVVVGTVLLFVPGAQLIGGALLINGLSYFKSTYDQYKITGDWGAASKNSSILFGFTIDTDWGYNNSPKNGIEENNNSNPLNILNNDPSPKPKPKQNESADYVYSAADIKVLKSMGAQHTNIFNNFYTEINITKRPYQIIVGPVTPVEFLADDELGWILDTERINQISGGIGLGNDVKSTILTGAGVVDDLGHYSTALKVIGRATGVVTIADSGYKVGKSLYNGQLPKAEDAVSLVSGMVSVGTSFVKFTTPVGIGVSVGIGVMQIGWSIYTLSK
jgi:RHS repeat-associated protein